MTSYRARDRVGRFNGTLQPLVDARLVTPSRISEYANINPATIEAGESIHVTMGPGPSVLRQHSR